MRKFKLTPLLSAIAMAVSVNAYAQDASKEKEIASYDMYQSGMSALAINSTLLAPVVSTKEATYRAQRYSNKMFYMDAVNRPYDNQLGAGNGAGVTIGLVDSGVQVSHPELIGKVIAGYNAITGTADITDKMGHGTGVAGVLAGSFGTNSLAEGIAPGANLVVAKVFDTGSATNTTVGAGISWVNSKKVPIMSLSLGGASSSGLIAPMQTAVANGTLIVAAMGNNGTYSTSYPAAFAKETWANGQIIAVGSVNANNVRSNYSSYNPTLANWTVFAPGDQIYTANVVTNAATGAQTSTYFAYSGTSFATPIVAGQAALIKSNWNFLSAKSVAQIIFQTSTHLCSNGGTGLTNVTQCNSATPDPIFGWGMVDIGKSLQPIGNVTVATAGGVVLNTQGSTLASSKGGTATGLVGLTTIGVDSFNRGFQVAAANVTTTAVTTASVPATTATKTTAGAVKFSAEYAYANNGANFADNMASITLGKASFSFAGEKYGYGFGTGGTSDDFFGLQSTGNTPLSLNGEAGKFNAPYFAMAGNTNHFGFSTKLSDGSIVRVGGVMQLAAIDSALANNFGQNTNTNVATVELQKNFGETTAVFTAGNMQETNAALGMTGTGAMAINNTTNTVFMSVAATKPVAEKTYLSGMISVGNTAGYTNSAASLVDGATASQSMAWSMGLARRDMFKDGDSLGFTVAMPLRTMTGSMNVTTATGQNQNNGSLQYTTQSVSLAPSGMEQDLELAYSRPANFGGKVTAMAQMKVQPGHDANAPTQYGIGLRYTKSF